MLSKPVAVTSCKVVNECYHTCLLKLGKTLRAALRFCL